MPPRPGIRVGQDKVLPINLNQFRAFYLTAREGSVTRAADLLHVTQPAVTMQIKALQEDVGVKLFAKYGKNIRLTDAGQAMFQYAQRIFAIVEEVEYALKGYAHGTQGSLTLGTTRSFARHLMPGLLSTFQEKHPKVKVALAEGNSSEIAEGLVRFKYDLGIIGRMPMDERLKVVPFSREEFSLVVPMDHPLASRQEVSLAELSNEPIIIREQGSGSRHAIVSLFESQQFEPSFVLEAGSVEFIKEYVIKGRGISFLYRPEIEREARQGLIKPVRIKEGPLFVHTDIVFPKDAQLSPPAEAFLDLIPRDQEAPKGQE